MPENWCNVTYITLHFHWVAMSVGSSGRIVIEVDPDMKRKLYSALALSGLTLKDWFLRSAETYLSHSTQMELTLLTEGQLPQKSENQRAEK